MRVYVRRSKTNHCLFQSKKSKADRKINKKILLRFQNFIENTTHLRLNESFYVYASTVIINNTRRTIRYGHDISSSTLLTFFREKFSRKFLNKFSSILKIIKKSIHFN